MAPLEKVNQIIRNQEGKKRQTSTQTPDLVALVIEAALSRKAENVLVMDLRNVTGMADYFIICEGTSDIQVKAVANAVKDQVKEESGERPWHSEGLDTLQWVLLDYVDVVAHIMSPEKREYYGLERLWGDATTLQIPNDASADDVRNLVATL